jgi:hypothetical protein
MIRTRTLAQPLCTVAGSVARVPGSAPRSSADRSVLRIRMAIVIGPTPNRLNGYAVRQSWSSSGQDLYRERELYFAMIEINTDRSPESLR